MRSLTEVVGCPAMRLDAEHYIPRHRRWECRHGNKLRSKASLVRAWLDEKISSEDLLEATRIKVIFHEFFLALRSSLNTYVQAICLGGVRI